MMICSNCKKEIADNAGFCEFCGAQLDKNASSHDTRERNSWHWRLRNALLALVPFAWFVFAFLEDDLDKFPELLWSMVVSDLIVLLIYEAIIYVVYGASRKDESIVENKNGKPWTIFALWLVSVVIVAIGADTKFPTSALECKSVTFCFIPSLMGKFVGASLLGIILGGLPCLMIKKWRNAHSLLFGALSINIVFFIVFIILQ